jgi:hypothetical protein
MERHFMTALPPFLMTSEDGSFAQKTIKERKPLIIDRILSHFDYTPHIRNALEAFKLELVNEPVHSLLEPTPDRLYWDQDLQPWEGKTWLEIPWFLAETYFYRRVLEIVSYFRPGPWQYQDPYEFMKNREIQDALPVFEEIYRNQNTIPSYKNFRSNCLQALWGNRGDLSNLHIFETNMGSQLENLVLDHTKDAWDIFQNKPIRIAYFLDNIGKELFFDLAFMDYLLQTKLAKSITCYMKNQPFFVSDAMPKDLDKSLRALQASQNKEVRDLAQRMVRCIDIGQVTLQAPPFLTTSRMYLQLPKILRNQLASHDLAILKGDVNYRRLFGDRHWPPTTPIMEAGGHFPTRVISLRTLKSEIILGISQIKLQEVQAEGDPKWLINGKRGMVTFLDRNPEV